LETSDGVVLLLCGAALWVIGTIYFAYRGAALFESTNLRYWISFGLAPIVTAVICVGILRMRSVPAVDWVGAMLLLAIPGMVGEAIVLSHFSNFMPRLQETSADRYGAFLFAMYAFVLGIAEVVTLQAKP
jgi:Zn-dependent protease with chaperone function